jgi:DivIVA domain-containing protein
MDPLTPDQIISASFPLTRVGRRGLDEDAVREYLDGLAGRFASLLATITSLQQQNTDLSEQLASGAEEETHNGISADVQSLQLLSSAQIMADHTVSEAQQHSAWVTSAARARYEQIVAEAHQHAAAMLDEMERNATARAREAAHAAVPSIPADAEELYAKAYGDVFRLHMRSLAEAMLKMLDELDQPRHPAPVSG